MTVFVKTFQNVQNRYFLCNTSRRLLLNFVGNSHCPSFLFPALLVCWKSFMLRIHWGSRNTLIQSNMILIDVYQRQRCKYNDIILLLNEVVQERKISVLFLHNSGSMTSSPCPKIDKLLYFIILLPLNMILFSKCPYLTAHIKRN